MNILELKSVTKSYGLGNSKLSVLKDVNFVLPEGQVCSIVGQSGCGKSTLLQIVGLLDNPDSGQVLLSGVDLSIASDYERTAARRTMLGFIYQFHHLLPEFTALENLLIPQVIAGKDIKLARVHAKAMLAALGLAQRADHMPAQLSGGEQQRIAIGRGVINQPKLLLADEPTGNLDPENASMIIELLLKMSKALNLSVLLVTHNLEMARSTDRVVTLKGGALVDWNENRELHK